MGLTRVTAAEAAPSGVRVNAVCPGPTDTVMIASIEAQAATDDPARRRREIEAKVPAGRYGKPIEVAQTIAVLLGDQASYINGAVLAVDGGIHRRDLTTAVIGRRPA